MTVLSPPELAALLDDVRRLAGRVGPSYAWLQPSAFDRRVGGAQRSARLCRQCGGIGCESCDGDDRRDDVSAVLAATASVRSKLDQACTLVARAVADLTGAANMLAEAESMIDRGADLTIDVHERTRFRAPAADVLDALDAKHRRVDRGDELGPTPGEAAAQGKLRDRLRRQVGRGR